MICKVCGKLSAHGDRCLYCGTKHGRIVNTVSAGHSVQTASIEEIYSAVLARNKPNTTKAAKKKNVDYAKRNKKMGIAGLVLGVIVAALAVVSVIFFILGLETWRIVSPDTDEYIYKTFPTNYVPFICGLAGIGIIIPAIIIAVVSTVRTFKNGYGTKKINISSVIITLIASVVLLPCGIYTMFNMPNFWFGDVDKITDDQYAYELLQDKEKDKLTDYVYKHYVDKLVDNPEYLSVYVLFGDYWVYSNGVLENTQTYSSNIAFCIDEIDVIYTRSDGDETKLLFNKMTFSYRSSRFDLTEAAVHAYDILTGKFDGSIRYSIADPQEVFVYDTQVIADNQDFINDAYSFMGINNDGLSAFNKVDGKTLTFDFVYIGARPEKDRYSFYTLRTSFDYDAYSAEYLDSYYDEYESENYEAWEKEYYAENYNSAYYDFDTYYQGFVGIYRNRLRDKMDGDIAEGIYDYDILKHMIQQATTDDDLYAGYVIYEWIEMGIGYHESFYDKIRL